MIDLDPTSLVIGAFAGGIIAALIMVNFTRRCTCLPPDFRDSSLDDKRSS